MKKFLMQLSDDDRAAITDAMAQVRQEGTRAARHLRRRIYEIRVDQGEVTYRVLFASVSRRSRILLSLDGFAKKSRKTPPAKIDLAERRLSDWEARGGD